MKKHKLFGVYDGVFFSGFALEGLSGIVGNTPSLPHLASSGSTPQNVAEFCGAMIRTKALVRPWISLGDATGSSHQEPKSSLQDVGKMKQWEVQFPPKMGTK